MASLLQLLPIAAAQCVMPQKLKRVPEPSAVMDGDDNIQDFDAIMETNVSISLCGMIDLIGRLGFERKTNIAVDLACGPGHFTLMLAKQFDFDQVIGVDLSQGMIKQATINAESAGLSDRVSFITGDATDVAQCNVASADLVTCTNSAHHLPTPDMLAKMLKEMDRIVADRGLCAVMDLTRLKNSWTVERYVEAMGREYHEANLQHLYDDFRNSMFAAWTPEEMREACPVSAKRQWHHFEIKPLPINQFLFTRPFGGETKLRPFEWKSNDVPIHDSFRNDYRKYHSAKLRSLGGARECK